VNGTAEIKNVTLPGDMCSTKDECLCQSNSTCECTSGACTTSVVVGDACDNYMDGDVQTNGNYYCPTGAYCDLSSTKTCLAQKADGEECDAAEQCSTGYACVKKFGGDTEKFMCTKFWTFESGDKFDGSMMRPKSGLLLTANDACSTHTVIDNDAAKFLYECRTASASPNGTAEADLRREAGPTADDCSFTAHDNATDPAAARDATDISKCGFNKDGASYCNKRKGDDGFQSIFTKVKTIDLTKTMCHAYSGLATCTAIASKIGEDNFKEWVRQLISTDTNGQWANYANNDNCVGASVTAEFWQGDNPDFAFNSLSMSSFAAIVLTISAMFYMF
jgi:hypothetical protein